MVDYFALALSHGLLIFAAWQLLWREDLDQDAPVDEPDQPVADAPKLRQPGLRTRA